MLGVKDVKGVISDLLEKLGGDDSFAWFTELKKFLRKEPCWTAEVKNLSLRLIASGKQIIIAACDGTQTLAQAKEMFSSDIHYGFKNFNLNKPGEATEETVVQVYELLQHATYAQMYESLGVDLGKLCMTQHQIVAFCEQNPDWLHLDDEHVITSFLFRGDEGKSATPDNLFVANAYAQCGKLDCAVYQFELPSYWETRDQKHRLVFPPHEAI